MHSHSQSPPEKVAREGEKVLVKVEFVNSKRERERERTNFEQVSQLGLLKRVLIRTFTVLSYITFYCILITVLY